MATTITVQHTIPESMARVLSDLATTPLSRVTFPADLEVQTMLDHQRIPAGAEVSTDTDVLPLLVIIRDTAWGRWHHYEVRDGQVFI